MAEGKLDLLKEYKSYYNAKTDPELIEFSEAQYLALEGVGAPGGKEFTEKVGALYPLAFGIKNISKKSGRDFGVPKLEGLWWVDSENPFIEVAREEWQWLLLIRLPKFITLDQFEKAKIEVFNKKKLELVNDISFYKMTEGLCVQIMHIGPYATEHATIEKIVDFSLQNKLISNGLHHEIYISDPRKADPEKMKTILRQPVKR
jgi:hypothetical protein